MSRPNTPPTELPSGGRRITVKRCCNGCNAELGDATNAELDAAVAGVPLPDTTAECGCRDRAAIRRAIEATEVWRIFGFNIDPIIDAVLAALPSPATNAAYRSKIHAEIRRTLELFTPAVSKTVVRTVADAVLAVEAPIPATGEVSAHQFNLAAEAFYETPTDPTLNEQGNRRRALANPLSAIGMEVTQ